MLPSLINYPNPPEGAVVWRGNRVALAWLPTLALLMMVATGKEVTPRGNFSCVWLEFKE